MKRLAALTIGVLACAAPAVATASASAAEAPVQVGTVRPAAPLFWGGTETEYVASAQVDPADCDRDPSPCFLYQFRVEGDVPSLRIALDIVLNNLVHDPGGHRFDLQVFRGDRVDGNPVIFASTEGDVGNSPVELGGFSVEVFLCKSPRDSIENSKAQGCSARDSFARGPDFVRYLDVKSLAGAWTVRVIPRDVDRWGFRMRAGLGSESSVAPDTPLRPNLRSDPPFEFTFHAPTASFGFFITDGEGLESCLPGERPGAGKVDEGVELRCLRFSAGYTNAGAGPLELRRCSDDDPFPDRDPDTGELRESACQRIYHADGSPSRDVSAGSFVFHTEHDHWHYDANWDFELFKRQRDGSLKEVSAQRKLGFCPFDLRLGAWEAFTQAPRLRWVDDRQQDELERPDPNFLSALLGPLRCVSPDRPLMGLSPGWGDVYVWKLPEQFVPFPFLHGKPLPGRYVVRTTVNPDAAVNPDGTVRETTAADNTGYAYIRVGGKRGEQPECVEILERGIGSGPDDPNKELLSGFMTGSRCEAKSARRHGPKRRARRSRASDDRPRARR